LRQRGRRPQLNRLGLSLRLSLRRRVRLTPDFGRDPLRLEPTSGSIDVPWRFQGRILESASAGTDLYDFGARSYDPSLGIFTSFDSVSGSAQNPATLNRYLYAAANPATLVDPDGHSARMYDEGPVVRGKLTPAVVEDQAEWQWQHHAGSYAPATLAQQRAAANAAAANRKLVAANGPDDDGGWVPISWSQWAETPEWYKDWYVNEYGAIAWHLWVRDPFAAFELGYLVPQIGLQWASFNERGAVKYFSDHSATLTNRLDLDEQNWLHDYYEATGDQKASWDIYYFGLAYGLTGGIGGDHAGGVRVTGEGGGEGPMERPDGSIALGPGMDRGDGRDIYGRFTGKGGYGADSEVKGLEKYTLDTGNAVDATKVRAVIIVNGRAEIRYYDGLSLKPDGTYEGVEVKGGKAKLTAHQAMFDGRVNDGTVATAILYGQQIQITSTYLERP
jgi:RHS repeat-associated protein